MQVGSLIIRDRQGFAERIPVPAIETTRAHLLEVIQRRPAPQPVQPSLLDVAGWERRSRGLRAQRILRSIHDTTSIATALAVSSRCIAYWRRGQHSPTPKHWRQLEALQALLSAQFTRN